ncbi:ATP-dependent Clp protease proteolytic subunit [Kribbella albertanoniae]|uniref:ATP-dependent Clp protease proteolytic subunit n=1 Tax=Kribbella albertanoniae TaxID=1266829 RepID=A0A4R4P2V7_9ACTN|nr:ATP-dependent Clp protease proteolytic subunit [Kribbella albertanoniae]TDC14282.1 ATP-dependent Clp protease proteolytic subunit [Kribbella albertanoniae]
MSELLNNLGKNVYERLMWQRILVLGDELKEENANALCAQLLLLNAEDPRADISLYINSPGGSVSAGLAIYDTMNFISNDVATYGMGLVASMGQVLLTCGTPGKRFALPHARIMMHQPTGGMGGTASDIKVQAEQAIKAREDLAQLIAERTGQQLERITTDFDRDRWFTPEAAREYGIVDQVLTRPAAVPA